MFCPLFVGSNGSYIFDQLGLPGKTIQNFRNVPFCPRIVQLRPVKGSNNIIKHVLIRRKIKQHLSTTISLALLSYKHFSFSQDSSLLVQNFIQSSHHFDQVWEEFDRLGSSNVRNKNSNLGQFIVSSKEHRLSTI